MHIFQGKVCQWRLGIKCV